MALIFVTPTLKTGGGNRVFVELANELIENNSISIISPNNSSDINTFTLNEKVELKTIGVYCNNKIYKLWNVLLTIKYINKKYKNDVVFISDPFMSLLSFFINNKRLYRFIQADDYTIFDDGLILGNGKLLYLYKLLTKFSYKNGKISYIFNSKYVYNKYCSISGRVNVPSRIVHPAINPNIFNTKHRMNSLNDVPLTICLVARKHPLKGLETFIKMWKNIGYECKKIINEVVLISHDDLSTYDLSEFTLESPKSDIEMSMLYQKSDIFISTSWSEGFGLPPLEAMACGCAVICSKSGGVDEYIKPNENSLVFEPKDEFGLEIALKTLIFDRELLQKLSINGVETSKRFNWRNSCNKLQTIIDYNDDNC